MQCAGAVSGARAALSGILGPVWRERCSSQLVGADLYVNRVCGGSKGVLPVLGLQRVIAVSWNDRQGFYKLLFQGRGESASCNPEKRYSEGGIYIQKVKNTSHQNLTEPFS
ncbi:hypothetical protein chiPu_0019665 [Chiloscyllium punctatum]|uniref:Uncharacterized protein n=1 Tax=Chiloscyllium punctatum TaxID=137246 RepID=A0A401RSU4_CHIPU|nr:hypothetical protein [Chiloscyllium punctatum]